MRKWYFSLLPSIILSLCHNGVPSDEWGFFGHRKINRMAVFTLPEEMLPLYKKHILYLEEHSVDPDKRRYATKHEAYRHYIDLDQWVSTLPKHFDEALALHSTIQLEKNDSISMITILRDNAHNAHSLLINGDTFDFMNKNALSYFYQKQILPIYYEDEWYINTDTFNQYFHTSIDTTFAIHVIDTLSLHGVLPYYLPTAFNKLVKAFQDGQLDKILQYSAELGHYIGDAHVPLHTSKNYNGQLTDQLGIHAFWESRIPELFADKEYDFFVGKALYIKDVPDYMWNVVMKSHTYLNEVLNIEKSLSQSYPSDRQFCYDERLGLTVRIQCKEYAAAYHKAMQGMVEERMTSAVHALGSLWYTAWINSGQPDLNKWNDNVVAPLKVDDLDVVNPKLKVRDHDH